MPACEHPHRDGLAGSDAADASCSPVSKQLSSRQRSAHRDVREGIARRVRVRSFDFKSALLRLQLLLKLLGLILEECSRSPLSRPVRRAPVVMLVHECSSCHAPTLSEVQLKGLDMTLVNRAVGVTWSQVRKPHSLRLAASAVRRRLHGPRGLYLHQPPVPSGPLGHLRGPGDHLPAHGPSSVCSPGFQLPLPWIPSQQHPASPGELRHPHWVPAAWGGRSTAGPRHRTGLDADSCHIAQLWKPGSCP